MVKVKNLTIWTVFALLTLTGCTLPGSLPESSALQQLKEGAHAGDVESQYQLGMRYTIQSQWAWDSFRGYRWFLNAAEQGHADAQYMVGMGKVLGRGTHYDQSGSIDYFRRAALQGQARAQYQLGMNYLNGAGAMKDKSWGRQWLEQAAWHEHKEAQFILGALFAEGVGGQPNLAEAWRWLQRAMQNGQRQAETALGTLANRLSAHDRVAGDLLFVRQQEPAAGGLYVLPQVRYVQTMLNRLGYSAGPEDGLDGSATNAAVVSYVRKNRLPHGTQTLQLIEILRGSYE